MARKKQAAKRTKKTAARGRSRAAAKTRPSKKTAQKKGRILMSKDSAQGQDLEQVRDLLFGSQMRENDKRFAAMEERLHASANELRDEIRKRFDSLEQYVKAELASLSDQHKKEQSERTAAVKQLTGDLADMAKQFESFAEKSQAAQQKLREQAHTLGKDLRDELRAADDAQTRARAAAVDQLTDAKTDRAALASMLNDLAMQLAGKDKPKKK